MNLLEELEAASKKAEHGPWTFVDDEYGIRIPEVRGECEGCTGWLKPTYEEDARYIALCSPDNIQKLIAAHQVMREALNKYSDHENDHSCLFAQEALAQVEKLMGEK